MCGSERKSHDLHDFMQQTSVEMSAEYARIQMRATEDPGTAGDQGEENWAQLLRDWLPRTYEVVTKGRIISQDGQTSPQIDLLVLKGSYPRKLLNKKLYLAAGVAAAFECKITLRASHLTEAVKNCVKIKSLYSDRVGTPYKELHAPLIYGLLAHSHCWKRESSTPEENVEQKLYENDASHVSHPRYQLDLLWGADLGTWVSVKSTFIGPRQVSDWSKMSPIYGPNGAATSGYIGHTQSSIEQVDQFTPIGALIFHLWHRLAWEDASLRDLADYYRTTHIAGSGMSHHLRVWPSSIYSEGIRARIEAGVLSNGRLWDEWSVGFF